MKRKNLICLLVCLLYLLPCYAQKPLPDGISCSFLSGEEWQAMVESVEDEYSFVYRRYDRDLTHVAGVVLDPDSIRLMIRDDVTILMNRYDWMDDEEEYVSGLLFPSGRRVAFMQYMQLIGYDPGKKILFFGFSTDIHYTIDLLTGWDKPLTGDCHPSQNRQYRVIYQYQRRYAPAPFVIQKYDPEAKQFYDLCYMGDFKLPDQSHLNCFCWMDNSLYIYFEGSETGDRRYVKVDFKEE